jgi:hypothetical protein
VAAVWSEMALTSGGGETAAGVMRANTWRGGGAPLEPVLEGLACGGSWRRVVLTAVVAMAGWRSECACRGETGCCFYRRVT